MWERGGEGGEGERERMRGRWSKEELERGKERNGRWKGEDEREWSGV